MAETEFEIGTKAPAFTLPDQEGKQVALKDFLGKWVVLYFYPRDDTPGCTAEARDFSHAMPSMARLGAVVLGVSPDSTRSHAGFTAKNKLKIALLSDPEHKVMEQYAAWGTRNMYGRKVRGVIRSTMLIDPQGRIAHHWPSVKPKGHAADVRKTLREMRE